MSVGTTKPLLFFVLCSIGSNSEQAESIDSLMNQTWIQENVIGQLETQLQSQQDVNTRLEAQLQTQQDVNTRLEAQLQSQHDRIDLLYNTSGSESFFFSCYSLPEDRSLPDKRFILTDFVLFCFVLLMRNVRWHVLV